MCMLSRMVLIISFIQPVCSLLATHEDLVQVLLTVSLRTSVEHMKTFILSTLLHFATKVLLCHPQHFVLLFLVR